jgi:hypothetical protein
MRKQVTPKKIWRRHPDLNRMTVLQAIPSPSQTKTPSGTYEFSDKNSALCSAFLQAFRFGAARCSLADPPIGRPPSDSRHRRAL